MNTRWLPLVFLIICTNVSGYFWVCEARAQTAEQISEQEDLKSVLDAFNQSVELEAKKKIEEAEQAERTGNLQESQGLIREAMMLETLKVEEGRITEEKLLALKDQMSSSEKKNWMKRFIQEGDRLANLGLYDMAVDEYEKVFLLEPENRKASQRIDRMKKQFLKEQGQILKEQGKQIDQELKRKVDIYLNQVEELVRAGNYSSAKRTLERLMTLDKKNKNAKKLMKLINEKIKEEKKGNAK